MPDFKGSIPALVTPFREGDVDYEALARLVEWHIEEGSHGLVAVGTTGESPTLPKDEHKQVVREVVRLAAGRIPVIAGTGSNSTDQSLDMLQAAEAAGADAALIVTPYYNKPNQAGLLAHYKVLHDNSTLPIILYNIPGRCVIDLEPETMAEMARWPRIIGVKDATGSMERVSQQRAQCGREFIQLSAEDAAALGFNAHGGVGCISVTANVAPRLCAAFQEACLSGRWDDARDLQDRLLPLHNALFLEPPAACAKYALSRLGLCTDEVRSPLTTLEDTTKSALDRAMAAVGLTG
ncbi:4-hydroxy-tetrahydrodipicolinate synthase [Roseibium denhamense]|uniref:4-hydroxy-tetrahydrodipicolinate synthase n=1 Tax=Roseibium denhamense TaxID=76305 RepID=A0ABY1NWJ2_9HYPH|nr:4-hydroxy-tetrahydrodipicolinate synthase [Roseibium denhamense]MTI04413.1 4-hydroxy-tetrahydrodipicolinate synthase [Roseibium denhamense]SMP19891.1 dihydrodipicolinate synthase [Roseibium denhamense]